LWRLVLSNTFYFNCDLWECRPANFWGRDLKQGDKKALEIMQDAEKWSGYMNNAVNDWFYSPRHHLTNPTNKIAWIGQAAMAYAIECSSKQTKRLWWSLTDDQRNKANSKAQSILDEFEMVVLDA